MTSKYSCSFNILPLLTKIIKLHAYANSPRKVSPHSEMQPDLHYFSPLRPRKLKDTQSKANSVQLD